MLNKSKKKYLFASVGLIFLYGISMCFYYKSVPISDFGNYYFGSEFFAYGKFGLQTYNVVDFNLEVGKSFENFYFLNYTPVPPATALFYLPFILFKPFVAKLIFNLLSVGLFSYALFRLFNFLKDSYSQSWIIILLPLAVFLPMRLNIVFGQSYLLLFALLVFAFLQYKKGNWYSFALIIAICAALKITPILFLALPFVRQRYNAVVAGLTAFVFISILPVFWGHGDVIWNYFVNVLPRLSENEISDPLYSGFQSFYVMLANSGVVERGSIWFYLCLFVFGTFILYTLINYLKRNIRNDFSSFGVIFLASALLTAYSNHYSMLLLIFVLPIFFKFSYKNVGLFLLLLFIVYLPMNKLTNQFFLIRFLRFELIFLLFLLVTTSDFKINTKLLAVCSILMMIYYLPRIVQSSNNISIKDYAVNKHQIVFNIDRLNDNRLILNCLDTGLFVDDTLDIASIKSLDIPKGTDTSVLQHKVYFNKQLFFLSDKANGIGFSKLYSCKIE